MTSKNLPNIPLYIGDWEKDCNVLSLEAEAGWLRIIFKMFTNGKQSVYKLPTKGLQNLWRVSEHKVEEILNELSDFNICEITTDGRFTEFTCRRYVKENSISEIRKESVSKRKDRYKTSTKHIQTTENENDYVNEIEVKSEIEVKNTNSEIPNFSEFKLYALEKEPSVNTSALKNKYDAWIENGWKNGNDKPIKNWKSSLLQTLIYIEKNPTNGTATTNRNR